MSELRVVAEERTELGKNSSRRIRRAGKIPVVVYGRDIEAVPLTLDPRDLLHVLQSEHGQNTIFQVDYAEKIQEVLIRDLQFDPVRGTIIHADLQKVAMDQTMTFEIPVEITGESPGIKLGGMMDLVSRMIEVACLPGDVPEAVFADISSLEIGDNLRVEDLKFESDKISILTDPDVVLVAIIAPLAAEVTEEEEEVAAEPEVIQKRKSDEE